MEMFLMAVCMSVFGLAVSCVAFGAATRNSDPKPAPQPELKPVVRIPLEAPRFFADTGAPVPAQTRVPIEVLLLQLEQHVRLEQAAAESFLHSPTVASLHSRTTSPLVH